MASERPTPDAPEPEGDARALSFAELARRSSNVEPDELPRVAQPRARDDELLDELPPHDHHLGHFAGWRATRKVRLFVGLTLAAALLFGAFVVVRDTRRIRHERRHPLPELEATITPGTPREMTLADGSMRVGLGREPPAINVLHLPDRDVTLARGSDKAQFKVEVREGKTVRLHVLTGEIVETLTDPNAQPLLE
jgi:hypothetical protein